MGLAAAEMPPFGGLTRAGRPLRMGADAGASGMQSSTSHHGGSCLGRTCLKWRHDGELARGDLELVLERLAKVDLDMAAERQRSASCQPCSSIS
jgi:hypothetical protein